MSPPAASRTNRVGRRLLLAAVSLLLAATLAWSHAPYEQWNTYRRQHLLILTHREDPHSYGLGKSLAALLAERLPSSRARVTRAPGLERVASLIATRQLEVALLAESDARDFLQGAGVFAPYGPTRLRVLAAIDDHLLVCRDDFPERHAYAVAAALRDGGEELGVRVAADLALPVHAGVRLLLRGEAPPEVARSRAREDHPHGP